MAAMKSHGDWILNQMEYESSESHSQEEGFIRQIGGIVHRGIITREMFYPSQATQE